MNRFTDTILGWYALNKRQLPWRNLSDPYRIWISEIILQQTRVAQGYDYFLRFTDRFPTVHHLATATDEEVMKLWQGLGYYSRARNLLEAARSLRGGEFPATYEGVRALKGVGDYTAAAICSFAYGMPYAVVDGNVYRVLARYFGIDLPIDKPDGKRYFARLAQELLPAQHAADYNQAIMDFGALQCTPQSPRCLLCPLADSCMALSEGLVARLPVKSQRLQVQTRYFNYLYINIGVDTWLHKRGAGDIWQGLYEFPLVEADRDLSIDELVSHPQFKVLVPADAVLTIEECAHGVKHVLTHRILLTNFYKLTLAPQTPLPQGYAAVPIAEMERYAVPRLIQAFKEKYL